MYSSDKALRALTQVAGLLSVALILALSNLILPSPAGAQGLFDRFFGGEQAQVQIENGKQVVQVDEACVIVGQGDQLLKVGDRCPDEKSKDQPAKPPANETPPEQSPKQTLDTTTPTATPTPTPTTTPATTPTPTTMPTTTSSTMEDMSTPMPEGDAVQAVTVTRAIDGDTFEITPALDDTDTVRLIGLDTPEMATDEAAVPEPYAEEASNFTAENLEGKEIYLQFDEDKKDDYGRLLAYAFLEDPTTSPNSPLFNETLLREGYATLFTVEPNVRYEDRLALAEQAAKDEGMGLWALSEDSTTGPSATIPVAEPSTDPSTDPAATTASPGRLTSSDTPMMGTTMSTTSPTEDSSGEMMGGTTMGKTTETTTQGMMGGTTTEDTENHSRGHGR